MDKTIELILVATVVLVTGLGVMFIFTGQSTGFDQFLDNNSQSSECDLLQTQYKQSGACDTQVNTPENIQNRWDNLNCGASMDLDAKC